MEEGQYQNILSSLLSDKKRLLIVGGFVMSILIVVISMFFFTPQSSNTLENPTIGEKNMTEKSPDGTQLPEKVSSPTQIPPTTQQLPAEEVAKRFYLWYVSTPSPLISGSYKTRQDITPEYKELMGGYVKRGLDPKRDPIFNCGDIIPKDIKTKGATYDQTQGLALVILQDVPSGRDLYQIKLKDTGGTWLVKDVWCAP